MIGFGAIGSGASALLTQEMILTISRLMKEGGWLIKGLTFDSAHAHRYIKEGLFGIFESLDADRLKEVDWWKDLTYEPLPSHAMPRLPLQLCKHGHESIWCLPGVCL